MAIIAPRDEPFTNDTQSKVRLRFESISGVFELRYEEKTRIKRGWDVVATYGTYLTQAHHAGAMMATLTKYTDDEAFAK